jgi:hypothetical protein
MDKITIELLKQALESHHEAHCGDREQHEEDHRYIRAAIVAAEKRKEFWCTLAGNVAAWSVTGVGGLIAAHYAGLIEWLPNFLKNH